MVDGGSMTFNRNEQITILVLTGALLEGSVVSALNYFFPEHVEEFHIHKGAIPIPEAQASAALPPVVAPVAGKVDINTASAKDLQILPRIGPRTAEHIVAHRAQNVPFQAVDDLTAVKGIGPKTLADIKPLIQVTPE